MFEDPVNVKKYLKIALFGKGGTGKTRFALSFPKPCVIDTEKGTQPYIGKYEFKLKVANRWRQLEPILNWLRSHPGSYETLVIDSTTVFYMDLIQDIIDYVKNKRGVEMMAQAEWGVEKRRWAAFLNQLIDLPMHIILSFREKDEYEETVNRRGEEIRKKTGNFFLDADKQTEYLFDLGYRCYTEEDKRQKSSKFLVTCTKTRYDWSPKYGVWDITKKRAFAELFEPHIGEMLDAPDAPTSESIEPIVVDSEISKNEALPESASSPADAPSDPPPEPEPLPPPRTSEENVKDMREFFGVVPITPDQPETTVEDIKILFSRASDMVWPDDDRRCRRQGCAVKGHKHQPFTSADGKAMIRSLYNVESSRELRKPQVEFLYEEFGKVLSGRAFLDRDGQGTPYIATPDGTTEEEVRANVLKYR